jgi:hypothetical protein
MPASLVFANNEATGLCVRTFDNDCGTARGIVSSLCLSIPVIAESQRQASERSLEDQDEALTIDKHLLEQTCDTLCARILQNTILDPSGLEGQSHETVSLAHVASERRIARLSVQLRRLCKDLGEGKRSGSVVPIWRDCFVAWICGPDGGIRGGAVDGPEVLNCVDRGRASVSVGGEGFLGKSRSTKGEKTEWAKEEVAMVCQYLSTWAASSAMLFRRQSRTGDTNGFVSLE